MSLALLDAPAPRLSGRQGEDFYRTPPAATEAFLAVERPPRVIWEPACGDGAISEVLKAAGHEVFSTDLYDRGYGLAGRNFLDTPPQAGSPAIVTNPPFKFAEAFVLHALAIGTPYIAVIQRLAWLEGAARQQSLWLPHPPSRIWVFGKRLTLWRGDEDRPKGATGTTAYGWFVWDRVAPRGTQMGWLP